MRGEERTNLTPALLAALALHIVVLAAGLIVLPWFGKPIQVADVTAITLVPSAPAAPPPPALQAPQEQQAAAPEPEPKPAPPVPPPPPPPPPEPAPRPQPKPVAPEPAPPPRPQPRPVAPKPAPPPKPQPSPTPKPKPKPKDSLDLSDLSNSLKSETKPKRESLDLSALGDSLAPEAKPQAKPKRESLDLSALSNSLTSEAKPQSRPRRDRFDLNALASSLDRDQKPSAATRGPSRSQTALTPRVEPGVQQATNDAAKTVGARLNRIWNKSCSVPGFRDQVVQVTFNLNIDGSLSGDPHADGYDPRAATVREGAIERALTAVRQAAPFRELPRETYGQWKHFTAIFNGREACQNQ